MEFLLVEDQLTSTILQVKSSLGLWVPRMPDLYTTTGVLRIGKYTYAVTSYYQELPTFRMQSRPGKGNCQEGTLSAVKPVKMTRVLL